MFIINQSGDWAVNTNRVDMIKQIPIQQDNKPRISIRVTVGKNNFILASYVDKQKADTIYTELLRLCATGGETYQMPEDRP